MQYFYLTVLLLMLVWSCTDEPVETVFQDLDTRQGIFIACEGNFMYGNGSVSFYHTERKKVTNQVFYARNNAPLGDVVQSLARRNDLLYMVVNNSGKVVIADIRTVEFAGVITGLTSPRYIHFVSDGKAYISDLYADHLTIFNPLTLQITGSVDLEGHTSEQMVQVGKYVYVSHWVNGEDILVIDSDADKLAGKIHVPAQPRDLVVDKMDKIWVLCGGTYRNFSVDDEHSMLVRIDPVTQTVEQIYRFEENSYASNLKLSSTGDTLYFLNNGVNKMSIDSRHLPASAFLPSGQKLFYHLAVHPENNEIYVSDAIDYTQDAIVYRFSKEGIPMDSFKTGINPSDLLFPE
ncbi:MAG: DUF5074 domain-containing protein [Mariniphaga sp.]